MTMGTIVVMQTIQASKFKARCLALMDEVARTDRRGCAAASRRAHDR